jgi:hypothetical protein
VRVFPYPITTESQRVQGATRGLGGLLDMG